MSKKIFTVFMSMSFPILWCFYVHEVVVDSHSSGGLGLGAIAIGLFTSVIIASNITILIIECIGLFRMTKNGKNFLISELLLKRGDRKRNIVKILFYVFVVILTVALLHDHVHGLIGSRHIIPTLLEWTTSISFPISITSFVIIMVNIRKK